MGLLLAFLTVGVLASLARAARVTESLLMGAIVLSALLLAVTGIVVLAAAVALVLVTFA